MGNIGNDAVGSGKTKLSVDFCYSTPNVSKSGGVISIKNKEQNVSELIFIFRIVLDLFNGF